MNKLIDIEKKFFEFSVLGYLTSRKKISTKYKEIFLKKETIENFFIQCENITKSTYDNYKNKHSENIKRITSLATKERQEGFEGREEFLEWYLKKEKTCCYCGVKEVDLEKYFNTKNEQYYRNEKDKARQRGKYLEIERVVTASKDKNKYTKQNTDLACYICNNTKSDFISPKNFKSIAYGINNFWKEQNIDATFPHKSDIWNK